MPSAGDYTWNDIDKTISSINDISDVDTVSTPAAVGDVLKWNGSNWIPSIDDSVSTNSVNSSSIINDSIVDADISTTAAIAQSKISGLTTSLSDLNTSVATNSSDIVTLATNKVDKTTTINGQALTGNISLTTTNVSEGTNLYYSDLRAKTASVVNSSAGSETDKAASVAAMKSYVTSQTASFGSGDITAVVAGSGLTGGATSGSATLNVNVGTGPNQIVQLNASSRLPAIDGSLLTNLPNPTTATVLTGFVTGANTTITNTDSVEIAFEKTQGQINASNTAIATKVATSTTINSKPLSTNITLTTSDIAEGTNLYYSDTRAQTASVVNTTAGSETNQAASVAAMKSYVTSATASFGVGDFKKDGSVAMTGDLDIGNNNLKLKSNNTNYVQIKSPDALGATYSLILPQNDGGAGEFLRTDGSGNLTWATPAGAGDITDVVAGTGLTGGAISGSATLNVNVGTGANQIVQLDGTSKLPAIDGSQLLNLPNSTASTVLSGFVTGANLPISNSDTVEVAFEKLQGQVDGINSSKVDKTISINGQSLNANVTLDSDDILEGVLNLFHTTARARSAAVVNSSSGSETDQAASVAAMKSYVTSATSTFGVGDFKKDGSVAMTGNLDLGNNQLRLKSNNANYVQLKSPDGLGATYSLILPPSDGGAGEVLSTDGSGNLSWTTPSGSGDITDVVAGTGLTGGATSGSATLNVNVGTGANQIVQLDASSKLPAIDGSQLINLPSGGITASLTGFVTGPNSTITATDTILTGFEKTQGQIDGVNSNKVDKSITVNGSALNANVILDTDDISEGSTNFYHTTARAQAAAVVDSTAGSETDQAASVSAMKLYVSSQVTASGDISEVVAGSGLTGGATTGSATLNVNVDNSTIEINTNALRVKDAGIDLATKVSGVLALANGGTGASDAATARTNLGLGSSATYDYTACLAGEVSKFVLPGGWSCVVDSGGGGGGSGDFLADGSVPMTNSLLLATGTSSAPSITFNTEQNLGFFYGGVGSLSFSSGGVTKFNMGTEIASATPGGGVISSAESSATLPAFRFQGDGDTGIFTAGVASDVIGFATAGAERMRIDNLGNIGINTTNAEELFHVNNGNVLISNDYYLLGKDASDVTTSLIGRDALNDLVIGDSTYDGGATRMVAGSNSIIFETAGEERLHISNVGHIGIGIDAPAEMLHLYKLGAPAAITLESDDSSAIVLDSEAGGGNAYVLQSDGTGNLDFYDITADTSRLFIQSGGNVGIGTQDPFAKLTIDTNSQDVLGINYYGTGTPTMFTYRYNGDATTPTSVLNGDGLFDMRAGGYITSGTVPDATSIASVATEDWSATNYGASLIFSTVANGDTVLAERMRISSEGKIGIGTTTPTEQLEVVGNVKGTQLCIGADCRTAWPVGTVTQITGGAALSDGPISGSGTLDVNVDGTSIEIISDALSVKDGGVTNAKLASDIDASKITAGTLATARLDVGTGANQIVKLDASSKLPAVDGSQLTNLPNTTTSTVLSGFVTGANSTVTNTDTVEVAFEKLQGQVDGLNSSKVDKTISVNGQTLNANVTLDSDDVGEGLLNLYFSSTRAKDAAIVNSTAGSETDQAASVSAMKSYVSTQVSSAATQWTTNSSDIYFNTGNVGIGVLSPSVALEVNGEVSTNGGKLFFRDNSIEDHLTNGNSQIAINYSGYNNTTTQFRDLNIYDGKASSIAFFDGSSGNIGVGTSTPSVPLEISRSIASTSNVLTDAGLKLSAESTTVGANILSQTNSDTNFSSLNFVKSRGSAALPTVLSSGDVIGGMTFYGYDEAAYYNAGGVYGVADGMWNFENRPSSLIFKTVQNDSGETAQEKMRLTSNGQLEFKANYSYDTAIYVGASSAGVQGMSMHLRAGAAGAGTDLAGGALELKSGASTGSGGSDIYFSTASPSTSGTATNNTSYKMVLKGSGSLGIGTITPGSILHLANTAPYITFEETDTTQKFFTGVDGSGWWMRQGSTANTDLITLKAAGNFGIGTTNPAQKLDVNGNIAVSGSTVHTSDERFKDQIHPIDSALSKIRKLNGVEFVWRIEEFKERKFQEGNDIGVIAQNVLEVFPEAVIQANDGYYSVAYSKLVAPLIEAVKELDDNLRMYKLMSEGTLKKIDENTRRIASLEKENKDLKERLEKLEKIIEEKLK